MSTSPSIKRVQRYAPIVSVTASLKSASVCPGFCHGCIWCLIWYQMVRIVFASTPVAKNSSTYFRTAAALVVMVFLFRCQILPQSDLRKRGRTVSPSLCDQKTIAFFQSGFRLSIIVNCDRSRKSCLSPLSALTQFRCHGGCYEVFYIFCLYVKMSYKEFHVQF